MFNESYVNAGTLVSSVLVSSVSDIHIYLTCVICVVLQLSGMYLEPMR